MLAEVVYCIDGCSDCRNQCAVVIEFLSSQLHRVLQDHIVPGTIKATITTDKLNVIKDKRRGCIIGDIHQAVGSIGNLKVDLE